MPAMQNNPERLDLRFRAEPTSSAARFALPGGLLLWCLLGIGLGLACWFIGRHSLKQSLAAQLMNANSAAEAMVAVEGLLLMDPTASLEIVGGLEHTNDQIARAAYRTLNSQITRWEELDVDVANARRRGLAHRLEKLSDQTSPSNLVLASSLASRIFSNCLEQDDPMLAPILDSCEVVIQRTGLAYQSTSVLAGTSEIDALAQELSALTPPPPLPVIGEPPTAPTNSEAAGIGEQEVGRATMRMVLSRTQPRVNEFTTPASENYGTSEKTSNGAVETAFSLSDDSDMQPTPEYPPIDSSSAKARNEQEPLPSMINQSATLSHRPPSAIAKDRNDSPELDGIQSLEIEKLVRLLGSVQPHIVKSAALALRSKGMNDEKLGLASELATCSAARRLELISEIARRDDMDPRPWLLWMAEDGQPEVRKMAVSLLSSMVDETVERSLQVLLAQELDSSVEQTIRTALLTGRGSRR
jgi:hypothetical protein